MGHSRYAPEGEDAEHEIDIDAVLDAAVEEPRRQVRGLRTRGRGVVPS